MQHNLFEYSYLCGLWTPSTFSRGSKESMFRQVLVHPKDHFMFWLLSRQMSFPIQLKSRMSNFVRQAVEEVDIYELGVRITIYIHCALSISGPYVPILRPQMHHHLSLFALAYLIMAPHNVLYLPVYFIHGIRGHPIKIFKKNSNGELGERHTLNAFFKVIFH